MKPAAISKALTVVACLLPLSALALVKPGLWDQRSSMKINGADVDFREMRDKITSQQPGYTPEMLAKMRAAGVDVDAMMSERKNQSDDDDKTCVTPGQAARTEPDSRDFNKTEDGCRTEKWARSGDTWTARTVCDGAMKGTGSTRFTVAPDGRSYTAHSEFKGTHTGFGAVEGAAPYNLVLDATGRWLGNNCGNVKPDSEE